MDTTPEKQQSTKFIYRTKGEAMVSALYASIFTLIIVWLSLNVIKNRRRHKISLGDGGIEELQIAIGTQANAVEYLSFALILLFALELNNANVWLVHCFGMAFIVGRWFHARGLYLKRLKHRVLGMQITIFCLVGLAIANLIYLPYGKIFNL